MQQKYKKDIVFKLLIDQAFIICICPTVPMIQCCDIFP